MRFFLIIMALASGYSLFGYSATAYLLMILMAVFPQLIGHSSYNWALGYLLRLLSRWSSLPSPLV